MVFWLQKIKLKGRAKFVVQRGSSRVLGHSKILGRANGV